MAASKIKGKSSHLLWNIVINVIVPAFVLTRLSGPDRLGSTPALVLALLFPLGYGVWQYRQLKKINFFSAFGFISILLTGGIGLFNLDPKWIAFKEAGVPFLIGLAVLVSQGTRYPLVKTFFSEILEVEKLEHVYNQKNAHEKFEYLFSSSARLLASTFFLSSVLNFILAKIIVVSSPGTEIYNQELGKMTALSYPIIVIPTMIMLAITLQQLFSKITKDTGLGMYEVVKNS